MSNLEPNWINIPVNTPSCYSNLTIYGCNAHIKGFVAPIPIDDYPKIFHHLTPHQYIDPKDKFNNIVPSREFFGCNITKK